MGTKNQVAKDFEKCLTCKSLLCVKYSATHWCPILTEKAKKEIKAQGGQKS